MPEPKEPTGGNPITRKVEKPKPQDTVDTSWVDLAEGKIGQALPAEVAQAAQIQATTDKKKAATVLAELQSMPKAVAEKDAAAFKKERTQFQKEFQSRADERNKNRKWYEKLLGKNKLTAVDIAQEEALRMNKLIQPLEKGEVATGERDALASELVERDEFGHKDTETIVDEEAVRKYAPDLVKALEDGNFVQARKEERKLYGMKGDERWAAERGVQKLLNQRVEALILSDDIQKMKELVHEYSPSEIGLGTLANMPKEIIQLPEVQRQLSNSISGWILNARSPETAREEADKLMRLKLMTAEGVAKVINSKEVQRSLSNVISGTIINGRDARGAKKLADEYVDLGIMTAEGVAKVINSPEVQRSLSNVISGTIVNGRDTEGAKRIANEYVDLRFMTRTQADKIIADASASRR